MRRARYQTRPFHLLRATLALYLLSALLLVAVHQHRGAPEGHSCALCTTAHTPALVAPATQPLTVTPTPGTVLSFPDFQRPETGARSTTRSRAPPQA